MKTDSLSGSWAGTAHNSNDWELKITISILHPFEIGSTLGIFNIPPDSMLGDIQSPKYSRREY